MGTLKEIKRIIIIFLFIIFFFFTKMPHFECFQGRDQIFALIFGSSLCILLYLKAVGYEVTVNNTNRNTNTSCSTCGVH